MAVHESGKKTVISHRIKVLNNPQYMDYSDDQVSSLTVSWALNRFGPNVLAATEEQGFVDPYYDEEIDELYLNATSGGIRWANSGRDLP